MDEGSPPACRQSDGRTPCWRVIASLWRAGAGPAVLARGKAQAIPPVRGLGPPRAHEAVSQRPLPLWSDLRLNPLAGPVGWRRRSSFSGAVAVPRGSAAISFPMLYAVIVDGVRPRCSGGSAVGPPEKAGFPKTRFSRRSPSRASTGKKIGSSADPISPRAGCGKPRVPETPRFIPRRAGRSTSTVPDRNVSHLSAIPAKDAELIGESVTFRKWSERRIGEMMAELRESGKLAKGAKGNPGGRGAKIVRVSEKPTQTLVEQGVDKHLADRSRKAYGMPLPRTSGFRKTRCLGGSAKDPPAKTNRVSPYWRGL